MSLEAETDAGDGKATATVGFPPRSSDGKIRLKQREPA
jgi:hypothetical protein